MRIEPKVTTETIDELRRRARLEPATALPELADALMRRGWQIKRGHGPESLAHFEEAADIYRRLAADDPDRYLVRATQAVSSLGLHYSFARADDLALAARAEAAAMAGPFMG